MANDSIKFALEFPQGRILFTQNDAAYFQSNQGAEAFMVWGERKELFGKRAISVSRSDAVTTPYSVVYEFADNGALTDARLVTQDETLRGRLAEPSTIQSLNTALGSGTLKLYSSHDTQPASVFNVAQFKDGRLLIQLMNKNELYLGTPEAGYRKLDAHLHVQGGNSMYYKLATGESIDLPYSFGGPRHGEPPMFNGEELTYLPARNNADPKTYGLDLSSGITALNPFSAGLPRETAPQPKPPAPKP